MRGDSFGFVFANHLSSALRFPIRSFALGSIFPARSLFLHRFSGALLVYHLVRSLLHVFQKLFYICRTQRIMFPIRIFKVQFHACPISDKKCARLFKTTTKKQRKSKKQSGERKRKKERNIVQCNALHSQICSCFE